MYGHKVDAYAVLIWGWCVGEGVMVNANQHPIWMPISQDYLPSMASSVSSSCAFSVRPHVRPHPQESSSANAVANSNRTLPKPYLEYLYCGERICHDELSTVALHLKLTGCLRISVIL